MSVRLNVECSAGELNQFAELVREGSIICANKHAGTDGDVRYWAVDVDAYPIMSRFKDSSEAEFQRVRGFKPKATIIMVNHIAAGRSPNGSGGGWHIDSVSRQHKGFMYITDCTAMAQGPFTHVQFKPWILFKFYSAAKYAIQRSFRYSEREVARLLSWLKPFSEVRPMLLPKGSAFFLDTSQLHRGAPITEGERILATAYMYDDEVPKSIRMRAGPAYG